MHYEEITGLCMPFDTEYARTVRCINPEQRGAPKIGMLLKDVAPHESAPAHFDQYLNKEDAPLWLLEMRYDEYEIDKSETKTRLIVPDITDKTGRMTCNDFLPVDYEIVDKPEPGRQGYVISMSDDEFFAIAGRASWRVSYGRGECPRMMDDIDLDKEYKSFDWEEFADSFKDHEAMNDQFESNIGDFMENIALARLYFDRLMRKTEEEGRGYFKGIEISSEDRKKRYDITYGK